MKTDNIYDIKKLKENLRELWNSSGLSQKELAEEIGINEKTLNNILNPDSQNLRGEPIYPDLKTLVKLCNRFNCDIDSLFGNLDYSKHDLKFICEYTGLSENAVNYIKSLSDLSLLVINENLSDGGVFPEIERYIVSEFPDSDIDGISSKEVYKRLILERIKQILDDLCNYHNPKRKVFISVKNNLIKSRESRREFFASLSEEEQERYVTSRLQEYKELHNLDYEIDF